MDIRRNRLGRSEVEVGEIGLGCMSLGTDPRRAADIVRRALELGVTHVDTADLYDRGENEHLVGAALAGVRDRVTIASKAGNRWREDGSGWDWTPDPDYLRAALEASLRRLGTDRLDLWQLHGGTLDDPIDEVIALFERVQDEGLIRAYGISSIRPNVIRAWLERAPRLASVQLQLSLLDRRPEEAVLPRLVEAGVSAIARGPLAKGLLADKAARAYLDHDEATVARVQAALARSAGARPPERLALRWVLERPAVATVIPGASEVAQLEANVGAAALTLTPDEIAGLSATAPALRYEAHR